MSMGQRGVALEIRNWLLKFVANATCTASSALDPSRRFVQLGLDSAGSMAMVTALGAHLGRAISSTAPWDHPTPEALAAFLASGAAHRSQGSPSPSRRHTFDKSDPIAIVGLSGRFPGADSPHRLWDCLVRGEDLVTRLPPWRARLEGYADDISAPRHGGFLERIDAFDPGFFGITRAEAIHMDPQQRLLLELAWELFQDSGLNPETLRGSRTGVFVGAMWNDYARLPRTLDQLGQHSALGFDTSGQAARISYCFGLHGPSMTINTACSSSLVAVHLACRALESGEAELAIAGGVNLIIGEESTALMTRFGAMAPDGRCKAFDARANGYVRGEGAGLLLLMPLSQAIRGGHPVYCLIRGSAVNNDGASNGITAPSPGAQVDVVRRACEDAGVEPATVDYVEAHGTGTLLGDPIEARALAAALTEDRTEAQPLRLGSVKTNVGHLESAAGVVSVIKVALALQHRWLPPSLNFEQPNPHIPFERLRLRVQSCGEPWPLVSDRPPRAGVSGFGFGGTNCHVILEGFQDDARPIVVRAPESCASGASPLELAEPAGQAAVGRGERAGAPLILVFSGQGGQWRGMARGLFRTAPAFRAELLRCRELLRAHVSWDLVEELIRPSASRFDDIAFVQPALFAYQVASVAELRAQGFEPDAVLGHSMGEVAAAHVAGHLTLKDALEVITTRSRLMASAPGDGAMLSVQLKLEHVEALVARHPGVEVAVINGRASIVLTGERERLQRLLDEELACHADGPLGPNPRWVDVSVASHSPQMDSVLPELERALAGLRPRSGALPMISTVTGALLDRLPDARYWRWNLRRAVRFQSALERVLADFNGATLLEVSPHPVLQRAMNDTLAANPAGAAGALAAHTCRRNEPEMVTFSENVALLQRLGALGRRAPTSAPELPVVVPVTAHERAAMEPAIEALIDASSTMGSLHDIAHTLGARASHQRHRVAVVVASKAELAPALHSRWAACTESDTEPARIGAAKRVFAYSGQGSQWAGMGLELSQAVPSFGEDYFEVLDRISEYLGTDLRAAIALPNDQSPIDDTYYSQPAVFAFQVALTRWFERIGIVPDAVVGHSVGEIAAAWAAGALSLEGACRLVAVRADVLRQSTGAGTMLAVRTEVATVQRIVRELEMSEELDLASINAPRDLVLAGPHAAIERAAAAFRERGIRAVQVRVRSPFHSRWVAHLEHEVARRCEGLEASALRVPMLSTVYAREVEACDLTPAYWGKNVREPVRFAEAIDELALRGFDTFIEVGSHPVLTAALNENLQGRGTCLVLATGRRKQPVRGPFLAAAALFEAGAALDFSALNERGGRVVPTPAPRWNRVGLWLETVARAPGAAAKPLAVDGVQPIAKIGAARSEPEGRTLRDRLARVFAAIVETPVKSIDFARSFFDLGMDSPMAAEFVARAAEITGLDVSVAVIFQFDDLHRLSGYLEQQLGESSRPRATAELEPSSQPRALGGQARDHAPIELALTGRYGGQ